MIFAIFRKRTFVRLQEAASAAQALQRHTYKVKLIGTSQASEFSARIPTKEEKRLACPGCSYSITWQRPKRCGMCAPFRVLVVASPRGRSRRSTKHVLSGARPWQS